MTKDFTPVDAEARERAINTHDRNITVEAGAGTGKTTLLTKKYLSLLKEGIARPSQIVAITFTEKAASQLRDRIREQLVQEGLVDALDELDSAPISTIHAFCASILREEALEIGIDPQFQQLDELDLELFLRETFRGWFRAHQDSSTFPLNRAFSLGVSLKDIKELAFALYHNRDLFSALSLKEGSPGTRHSYEGLFKKTEELQAFASETCRDESDLGFLQIDRLFKAMSQFSSSPEVVKDRAILSRLKLAKGKGAQKNWVSKDACGRQKALSAELAHELHEAQKEIRGEMARKTISWMETFLDWIEGRKQGLGFLDFDDLLILLRNLLRLRPAIAKKLQNRFKFFLIDEFQDTDPIQAEIVWRLCATDPGEGASWKELSLEPGKLFLVGDPKQSIYRFRKADLDLYRHVTGAVAETGERLLIQQNFRSSKDVLDFVNRSFQGLLGEIYEDLEGVPGHRSHPEQVATLLLTAPTEGLKGKASEIRRMEAEAIAASIRELLDGQKPLVWDPKRQIHRKSEPGDIGILFPTTTDIDVYEELLREYDLSFSLEGGKLFYGRTEIHALTSCLNALVHPADALSVVAALRSPFFGLSDVDLSRLFEMSGTFDYRSLSSSDFDPPIKTALQVLQDFHMKADALRPSAFIRFFLGETVALPGLLRRRHGEQAVANLEKFIAIAQKLEKDPSMNLERFTSWLNRRSVEGETQTEAPLSERSRDRIQLMTIHKSKGLEFPIVILANVSGEKTTANKVYVDRLRGEMALGWGPKDARFATEGYEELLKQEEAAQEEERKRLLYVAMTRAKDLLILSDFGHLARFRQYWKLLEEAVESNPGLKRRGFENLSLKKVEKTSKKKIASQPSENSAGKDLLKTLQDHRKSREKRPVSFHHREIHSVTSVAHEEDPARSSEKNMPPSAIEAMKFGSAIHRLLQDCVGQNQLEKCQVEWTAREFDVREREDELREMASGFLESPLYQKVKKAKKVFRELPIAFLDSQRQTLQGSIDLVFVGKDGLEIVDYKSDRISEKDLSSRSEHYRKQLSLYEEAIEKAWGRKVAHSWLYFLHLGKAVDLKSTSVK